MVSLASSSLARRRRHRRSHSRLRAPADPTSTPPPPSLTLTPRRPRRRLASRSTLAQVPCLRVSHPHCRRSGCMALGWNYTLAIMGTPALFQTLFLFIMATWKKYCWVCSMSLDGVAPRLLSVTAHLAHRPRKIPMELPKQTH